MRIISLFHSSAGRLAKSGLTFLYSDQVTVANRVRFEKSIRDPTNVLLDSRDR